MVLVTVHLHVRRDFFHLAIHPDIQITFAPHAFEEFAVVSLTTAYQWCQYQELPSAIVVHDHVDDLLFCVFHHQLARLVAVGLAGTGKQQSHEVVDLCGSAHRRAWVLVGRLLLNADDRA